MANFENVLELLNKCNVILVNGPTGCGKSTKLPELVSRNFGKTIVVQPRITSCIQLANRVNASCITRPVRKINTQSDLT
jgi:HrpA-like RNA helicase